MNATAADLAAALVQEANQRMEACLEKIGHCLDQLNDEQIWNREVSELNSIGNILLHLSGNLRQWLISGIGGSPDTRNRPAEFADRNGPSGNELFDQLRSTIAEAKAVLKLLSADQLLEPRRIQGFELTVLGVIFDSVPHLCGHTQEIVRITRRLLGPAYQFHWTPDTPEAGAAPEEPPASSR